MFCSNCGTAVSSKAKTCPACGHPFGTLKNKAVFIILALLFGNIGIHRFYLGNVGLGILYFLFCWTFIPAFIALGEAIVIGLRKDDPRFE